MNKKIVNFMRVCPLCGENVTHKGPGEHFRRQHQEYRWHQEQKEGNVSSHYYCDLCGMAINGFEHLIEHYEQYHQLKPNRVDQPTTAADQPILKEGNVTVSALDRLLEQVNINTECLKEEQKKNRELVAKCTSYAARIVELQNQLSEETKRRY